MAERKRVDFRLTGIWPFAYMGVEPISTSLMLTYNRAPTTADYYNYDIGTLWVNRSTAPNEEVWILVNKEGSSARWLKFLMGSANLQTLTGDIGGAISPDGADNINIVGSRVYLFTGNPGTFTLQLSNDGSIATTYIADINFAAPIGNILNVLGGIRCQTTGNLSNTLTIDLDISNIASSFITDSGTATVNALGELNVLGGLNLETSGASNTVTISTITLASGLIYVDGTGAFISLGNGNDGELLIGATGLPPTWNTLSSSGGTVSITNGPNTINLESSGGFSIADTYTTDSGTATVVANNINIFGGDNMNTSGSADNVYIHLNETIHWPATNWMGYKGLIRFRSPGSSAYNVFMHNWSWSSGSMGTKNAFLGLEAGNYLFTVNSTHGINILGIGYNALTSLNGALGCTAVGYKALSKMDSIGWCDAIGASALEQVVYGGHNVAIGYRAGYNYTGYDTWNICIGANVTGTVGETYVLRIGSGQTSCFIAGIRGITTGVADAIPVLIDSGNQLGTVSSSIRYKTNVIDMAGDSSALLDLRPVTFEYKAHPGIKQYGLIAEEVEPLMPRLVVHDDGGDAETVKYMDMISLLLNEINKLTLDIEELEKRVRLV